MSNTEMLFVTFAAIFFGIAAAAILFAGRVIEKVKKKNKQLESDLQKANDKIKELELQISNPSKFQVGEIVCGYSIEGKRFRKLDYRAHLLIFGLSKLGQLICNNKEKSKGIEKSTNDFLKSEWVYTVEKEGLKGFKTEIELQEIINQNQNQNKNGK
jgi:hypothetical protein